MFWNRAKFGFESGVNVEVVWYECEPCIAESTVDKRRSLRWHTNVLVVSDKVMSETTTLSSDKGKWQTDAKWDKLTMFGCIYF